jgi:hypothetical protein
MSVQQCQKEKRVHRYNPLQLHAVPILQTYSTTAHGLGRN